jgi:hypothetical protein
VGTKPITARVEENHFHRQDSTLNTEKIRGLYPRLTWKVTRFPPWFCPLTHGSTFPVNLLREPHEELESGYGTWVPYRPSELCITYVIDSSKGRGIGGLKGSRAKYFGGGPLAYEPLPCAKEKSREAQIFEIGRADFYIYFLVSSVVKASVERAGEFA